MMPNPLLSICLSSLPLCKLLSVAISHNLIRQAYLRHNCHLSACCSSAVASQYSLSPSCQHHYCIIPMTVWADLQAALQELSKQLNQQIQVYTRRGFQIKDVNSGMTHGFGKEPSAPTAPSFHQLQPAEGTLQSVHRCKCEHLLFAESYLEAHFPAFSDNSQAPY